jgi:hypothetical protein
MLQQVFSCCKCFYVSSVEGGTAGHRQGCERNTEQVREAEADVGGPRVRGMEWGAGGPRLRTGSEAEVGRPNVQAGSVDRARHLGDTSTRNGGGTGSEEACDIGCRRVHPSRCPGASIPIFLLLDEAVTEHIK